MSLRSRDQSEQCPFLTLTVQNHPPYRTKCFCVKRCKYDCIDTSYETLFCTISYPYNNVNVLKVTSEYLKTSGSRMFQRL